MHHRRTAAAAVTLTLLAVLAACSAPPATPAAAPSPTATATESPQPSATATPAPTPTPSATPAPSATPVPSATPAPKPTSRPNPTPVPAPAVDVEDLINTCLYNAARPRVGFYDQLMRSDVPRDQVRFAWRPDGQWYVVLPVLDPFSSVPVELNCTARPDKWVTFVTIRPSPQIDDFDRWASGELPGSGGL